MKKFIALILSLLMCVSLLTGIAACDNNPPKDSSSASQSTQQSESSKESSSESASSEDSTTSSEDSTVSSEDSTTSSEDSTVSSESSDDPAPEPEPEAEIVGAKDCSSAFGAETSTMLTLDGDGLITFLFTNHNSGSGSNWENFIIYCTNGVKAGEPGYVEDMIIRADNFAWRGEFNNNSQNNPDLIALSCDWNWDNYVSMMNGAAVCVLINREGSEISMKAEILAADGTYALYTATYTSIVEGTFGVYLTTEHAWLEIELKSVTSVDIPEPEPEPTVVGATDFSTPFFGARTDMLTVNVGEMATFAFVNHSDKAANWHNFLAVITNNKVLGDEGYSEHMVVRPDRFAWNASGNSADNPDLIAFTGEWNWDTFLDEMDGAMVAVAVVRTETQVSVVMSVYPANATETTEAIIYSATFAVAATEEVGVFLTVENAYLDVYMMEVMPIESMPE